MFFEFFSSRLNLFTPQDLAALREQFENADTDGSSSGDATEMGNRPGAEAWRKN